MTTEAVKIILLNEAEVDSWESLVKKEDAQFIYLTLRGIVEGLRISGAITNEQAYYLIAFLFCEATESIKFTKGELDND